MDCSEEELMVKEDDKELLNELVLADDEEVTEDTIEALSNNRGEDD